MQNCIDPVIARRRHAETATYCWKHSEHATVHQPSQGDAGLRTVNNNRMSGTHRHDGSSRTSTTIRHPQDASDTHCQYRHPKDASNHADGKAVGKQQAFATTHGVLAKNPANLYKATAIESHHYDADIYPKAVSNTGCYATECQGTNHTRTAASAAPQGMLTQRHRRLRDMNRDTCREHDASNHVQGEAKHSTSYCAVSPQNEPVPGKVKMNQAELTARSSRGEWDTNTGGVVTIPHELSGM